MNYDSDSHKAEVFSMETAKLQKRKRTLEAQGAFDEVRDDLARKVGEATVTIINDLRRMKGEPSGMTFDTPGATPREVLGVLPVILDEALQGVDVANLNDNDQKRYGEIQKALPAYRAAIKGISELRNY